MFWTGRIKVAHVGQEGKVDIVELAALERGTHALAEWTSQAVSEKL